MGSLHEVLVSDVIKMSTEELRSRMVITLKDPENWTANHTKRLQYEHAECASVFHTLIWTNRLLVNKPDESRGVDLGAVNEKLRYGLESPEVLYQASLVATCLLYFSNLTEVISIRPESGFNASLTRDPDDPVWREQDRLGIVTPDPNDPVKREQDRLKDLHWEHEAYHDLIRNGGRPSHLPNDSGFDYLDKYLISYQDAYQGDYLNEPQGPIIWYWATECPSTHCIFKTQRCAWEKFREHQDWRRWRYWKPEWFERFVQEIREYRQKNGMEGDAHLLQDRKEQSRLGDWVEFQYWEYKKADRLVKAIDWYAKEVEKQEERLQVAIDTG